MLRCKPPGWAFQSCPTTFVSMMRCHVEQSDLQTQRGDLGANPLPLHSWLVAGSRSLP